MDRVLIKIRRQDDPGDLPYWEQFEVEARAGMTVVGALAAIRERPVTADGNETTPVVWESSCREGACGACAMVINGRARLACRSFVDELAEPITLEPLSKFPVTKDLLVDRSRMFDALENARAWIDTDGVHEHGIPPRVSPEADGRMAALLACVMCGACSEACPQVNERSPFVGAFLFAQVEAAAAHPLGAFGADERMDALISRGGISDCAGSQACAAVCPRFVPLAESIARLEWRSTAHAVRRLFRG